MANTRTFSAPSAATAASPAPAADRPAARSLPAHPNRHRLRAVDRDEVAGPADMTDFLPPGATWLPAPPHTLPALPALPGLPGLPGLPPMIGYLVLVPAGRQPAPDAAGDEEAYAGPVRIDVTRRTASVGGVALDLTYLEFELLAHLVAHPHRVHTRDQLVTAVWGYGHVGDGRTVDVHVARLRRKLGAEYRRSIRTVRRVGYAYTP
ncbi:winged helix-turn-helix domain-containing protein [Streptomyces sp. SM11]|uniref:winged helix-turn-helix domain-containing protein n=1 Tax=Streptomyces sp. SM11 TaxID=565557 RepID=UPI000CD51EC9|nr:winged helix-turn-helix domain-containing protein [Streptomyces sp. SM11]